MKKTSFRGSGLLAVLALAPVLGLVACSPPGTQAAADEDTNAPIKIGMEASITGPLAGYTAQCLDGFDAGLDYATDGTNEVNGRQLEVVVRDDASDEGKVAATFTDLISNGAKLIVSAGGSGVTTAISALAKENDVLYINGYARTDLPTGYAPNVFRSVVQNQQNVKAMSFALDESLDGKKVTILTPDSAFGQSFVQAATPAFEAAGATVTSVLSPATATDLLPFAKQAKDEAADLYAISWAGDSSRMWLALSQQEVLQGSTGVVTLDFQPTHAAMAGALGSNLVIHSDFFDGAVDTPQVEALRAYLKENGSDIKTPDLYSHNCFDAALMAVRALSESPEDVDGMISALEGWTFDASNGPVTIRAEDHAFLAREFTGKLVDDGGTPTPVVTGEIPAEDIAPAVTEIQR
jgi:branched-chain amino acid transport system substrate-binding protein